jgi:hypothetical protein
MSTDIMCVGGEERLPPPPIFQAMQIFTGMIARASMVDPQRAAYAQAMMDELILAVGEPAEMAPSLVARVRTADELTELVRTWHR